MNVKRLLTRAVLVIVIACGYAFYLKSQIKPPIKEVMRIYDADKNLRVRRFLRYGNHGQFSLHYEPSGQLVNGDCEDYLLRSDLKLHGQCREGRWEGIVRGYDANDRVVFEGNYTDGMKHGVFKTYRNGKLNRIQQFRYGRLHGHQEDYYSNGQVNCTGNYQHHRRDGFYKCFYASGQPMLEDTFRQGLRHGMHRQWDSKGNILWEMPFKNGNETLHSEKYRVRSVISGDTILLDNDKRVKLKGIEEIPSRTGDNKSRPREVLKGLLKEGSRYHEVRLEFEDSMASDQDWEAYVFIDTGLNLDQLRKRSNYDAPSDEYYDFYPVRFSHFLNATLLKKGTARVDSLSQEDRYYSLFHTLNTSP